MEQKPLTAKVRQEPAMSAMKKPCEPCGAFAGLAVKKH